MTRLIKRYGSRKLYDTTESRYVSLDEISGWIRDGQEIQVIDNASSEDVSAQTLTQIISEEGRKRSEFLSSELLHDLIRAGGEVVTSRVKQLQDGVEGFVKKSLDRLTPVSSIRAEMSNLRARLDELEKALDQDDAPEPKTEEAPKPKPTSKKTTRKTATNAKTAASRRARTKSGDTTTATTRKPRTAKTQKKEEGE